jgi:hypothetical protein
VDFGGDGDNELLGVAESDVVPDRTVTVIGGSPFAPPQLRPVSAAWNPIDPAAYAAVRSKLVVTPDKASKDILLGGAVRRVEGRW